MAKPTKDELLERTSPSKVLYHDIPNELLAMQFGIITPSNYEELLKRKWLA